MEVKYLYIIATIFFTVYSQIIIKWQVNTYLSTLPNFDYNLKSLVLIFLSPWIISAIFSTFFAGVAWMLAMTKFDITYAFPFMSLNYVLILFFGYFLFGEIFSYYKLIGSILIIAGIIVIFKGSN